MKILIIQEKGGGSENPVGICLKVMCCKNNLSTESVVYWYAVHPEACLNFPDKQVHLIKDDPSAQKLCYIYALKPSGLRQNTTEMEHAEIRALINVI